MNIGVGQLKAEAEAKTSFTLSTGRTYVLKRLQAKDESVMDKRLNELGSGYSPAVGYGLYKCFVEAVEADGTKIPRDEVETEADYLDAVPQMDAAEVGELFFIFLKLRGLSEQQEKMMAQGFRQRMEKSTP